MRATRDAYGEALVELGGINKDIVVLDADLSGSTKTKEFQKVYPERFFNMGIAEQNLMGVASGLAASGKKPFASTFAVFATGRAYDQIRNAICYPKLGVKIAATHAGITVGEDGGSHQMLEDINLMRGLPNMQVFVPADASETKAIIHAVAELDTPCYIRMGRSKVEDVMEGKPFQVGKGSVLREGIDATIIACGVMVAIALEASELLAEQGISVTVINMSSIKPIDKALILHWARETGAVLTAEEHSIIGGLGSAVAEVLSEDYPVFLKRIGVEDAFGQSGKPDELMELYGLTKENLVQAVQTLVAKK